MSKRIWRLLLMLFVIGIATTMLSTSIVRAQPEEEEEEEQATRWSDWYNRQFFTGPEGSWGQTWEFGPDIGMGQTGRGYQYVNPMTGQMTMYQSTGYGMGTIAAPVWGGYESPWGQQSYGPFWGGSIPQVQQTPFAWSQGSQQGSIWGQSQMYQYQPMISPFMLGGGFGGGWGGLGSWGGLGGSSLWGSSWGGFPGGFTGFSYGSGGYGYPGGGYPQRIY